MEQSSTSQVDLLHTPLYATHKALGAKMVEFCGWEMPVYYDGIISEHHTVRQHVGLFDISHMGRIQIEGEEAESFLNYASTNIITGKSDRSATYTLLGNNAGGTIDDVMIFKVDKRHFFLVANACNRKKVFNYLSQIAQPFGVTVKASYLSEGILALQGPDSYQLMKRVFPSSALINPMQFEILKQDNKQVILSHTGYTGSGGFEIFVEQDQIVSLWERFLNEGKEWGIRPIGLGARDTLRLEKGYALYGHEMTEDIAPTESVAAWTVKWQKENFVGKAALEALENSGSKRHAYGIIMIDPGIPRSEYEVYFAGKVVGIVTSGTMSPTLNQGIGMILVEVSLQLDDVVDVQIRDSRRRAKIVKLPFI